MKLNDFLKRWYKTTDVAMNMEVNGKTIRYTDTHIYRPRVVCKDGFSVSVQADKHRCCEPKGNAENYSKVELINPSKADQLIAEYALGKKDQDLTDVIYVYVPVSIVDKLLAKHGGITGPDEFSLEMLSKCRNTKYIKQKCSW